MYLKTAGDRLWPVAEMMAVRPHWVQHITFEGTANGVAVRSYWKVVQGLASASTRTLPAVGFYFCVKFDGRWLIKLKRIYRCNDETPLLW